MKKITSIELKFIIKEYVKKLNKINILENEKKKLISELKILKESYDIDVDYELKKIIIDSIDLEGYDLKNVNDNEKIKEFYKIFLDEKSWNIKQIGVKRALEDYLRGMPSAIDLPTYYYDVRNLLYSLGFDEVENMEDEEIDKFYYKKIVEIILSSL